MSEFPDDMHYHAGYWPHETRIRIDRPFDLDELDEIEDVDIEEIMAMLERKFG